MVARNRRSYNVCEQDARYDVKIVRTKDISFEPTDWRVIYVKIH